jgi:hypothetical protein
MTKEIIYWSWLNGIKKKKDICLLYILFLMTRMQPKTTL